MPKRTRRKVTFHGAFTSKERARKKERRVGGTIKAVTVRGRRRYVVMTRKRRRR